jgi:lipoyl(octanoyl) transferase 2
MCQVFIDISRILTMLPQRLLVELIHLKNCISYARGQSLQSHVLKRLVNDTGRAALLLFEFEPVYTCGLRRSSSIITSNDIERFHSLGAHFHETDRGGLLTFHGPGQLVAYPILPLHNHHLSLTLRTYIDRLEQTLVNTCRKVLQSTRVHAGTGHGRAVNHAGAWIDNQRKVAFMGIRYSRGITSHGVSINCSVDMNWFDHIAPCGFNRQQITSLHHEIVLSQELTVEKITPLFIDSFQRTFDVDLIDASDEYVNV